MLPEPMKAWLTWSERPILVLGFVSHQDGVKTVWVAADGSLNITDDQITTRWRYVESAEQWSQSARVPWLDTEPVSTP